MKIQSVLIFSVLLLLSRISTAQISLDKPTEITITNYSSSDSLPIHIEGYIPLSNAFYSEDTIIASNSSVSYQLNWPYLSKMLIEINGEKRFIHVIPEIPLLIFINSKGEWNFPMYGTGYADYSAHIMDGLNRLDPLYFAKFENILAHPIWTYEQNVFLSDSLELDLRRAPISERQEIRKNIVETYDFKDTSLFLHPAYRNLLNAYFFSTYDEVMSDTISNYGSLSYFEKEKAREAYYSQKHQKSNWDNVPLNEYLDQTNAIYWTYSLNQAAKTVPQDLLDLLILDSFLSMIKIRPDEARYTYSFAKKHCQNAEIMSLLEKEYANRQSPEKPFQK